MCVVERIDTEDGFDSLREEWNRLITYVSDISIFQTYDFLRIWWRVFGEAGKKLQLLAIKNREGTNVVGIVPLFHYRRNMFNMLRFLADDLGDYIDAISAMDTGALSKALVPYFHSDRHWDGMMLNGIVGGSVMEKLLPSFEREGLTVLLASRVSAPRTRLHGTWETFYGSLGKGLRKDTEYNLRRLSKIGPVRLERVYGNDVPPAIHALFDMHQNRWGSVGGESIFSDPNRRRFFLEIGHEFDKKGWLHLSRLVIGEKVVAIHFGYQFRKRYYYCIPTFNIEFSKFSVGRILMMELMRHCFENGFELFDFMAGGEDYKGSFSNEQPVLYRYYVFNRRLKSRILCHLYRGFRSKGQS